MDPTRTIYRVLQNFVIIIIMTTCMHAPTSAKKLQDYPRAKIKVSYACHDEHLKTDAKAYTADDNPDLHIDSLETDYH